MTTNNIRIRSKRTNKFFNKGSWDAWFCDAEVIEKDSYRHRVIRATWKLENTEEVAEIDDSKKPVKTSDSRGSKSWSYKGRTIYTEAKRRGSYPQRVETWTVCRIGTETIVGGFRDAVKLIDAGKA